MCVLVNRIFQTKAGAQRGSRVFAAGQTARLQNRYHAIDKAFECIWCAALNDEAIGRFALKPQLQTVGYLLWRAVEQRTRRRGFQRRLAQRVAMLARLTFDFVGGAAEAVLPDIAEFRERLIQRIL